jgi:hypothetical protein
MPWIGWNGLTDVSRTGRGETDERISGTGSETEITCVEQQQQEDNMGSTVIPIQQDQSERTRPSSAGDVMIEAIAEAVAVKLERMMNASQRLMDVDEAARYLGLSAHALRHKASIEVPCVRIDAKLRFDRRILTDRSIALNAREYESALDLIYGKR